jgi:hypothetical protein
MTKSLWYIALPLSLVLPGPAWAEIDIAPACRVKNSPPGRCGWCAVETLARYHGLRGLYGLAQKNPSTCNPGNLEEALVETGICYRIQYPGRHKLAILRYAIREKLGAVIGFRQPSPNSIGHIVTLVDFTEAAVKIIDSNDTDLPTRQMSLDRFLAEWDGFALVLEPDSSWVQLPATEWTSGNEVAALEVGGVSLHALLPFRGNEPLRVMHPIQVAALAQDSRRYRMGPTHWRA